MAPQWPEILARARAIRDGLDVWIGQGHRLFAPDLAGYLNEVFAHDTEAVPAGVILFCPKPGGGVSQVTSRGDQSLQAIAQAHHDQCSGIVRATAEHSAGGKFGAALAGFLDTVFSHSTRHLPKGVRLFYQKH